MRERTRRCESRVGIGQEARDDKALGVTIEQVLKEEAFQLMFRRLFSLRISRQVERTRLLTIDVMLKSSSLIYLVNTNGPGPDLGDGLSRQNSAMQPAEVQDSRWATE